MRAFGIAVALLPALAHADPSLALFRLDPLGVSSEIVAQLENILRVELGRAVGKPAAGRAAIEAVVAQRPELAGCTASPPCLALVARALGVDRVAAGSMAGLGDSYVLNLRLVDARGREERRIEATIHGRADELIEEVRVAAYRLAAPDKLTGELSLLSEVEGADVEIDGRRVGTTPLRRTIEGLAVGDHSLRVVRRGDDYFAQRVTVRFEKATEVVVRQRAASPSARHRRAVLPGPPASPFYSRWWFWLGASAVAIGAGVALGAAAAWQEAIPCPAGGCR